MRILTLETSFKNMDQYKICYNTLKDGKQQSYKRKSNCNLNTTVFSIFSNQNFKTSQCLKITQKIAFSKVKISQFLAYIFNDTNTKKFWKVKIQFRCL